MIRDLLEATRAESGKMRVELRCISLKELVQQAAAMLRPTAEEKKIGLEIGLDQRLPLVHADPDRVLEVLINLVDNAIKFTAPEGSVVIKACMVEADPGSVYLSVSDTGRGIGPEAKALIFERLYQDPDSVDNSRSGLGLGLFICREIVRLHQGRIWVSSELGQGSTFTFTLPVYSLAKLLAPVITYEDHLRPAFVLVRVELIPLVTLPRGSWKDTWRQCLEILRHCVYLDKDLVLPPMATSATSETLFVVASTDLQGSGAMTMRIREQMERLGNLNTKCTLTVSALPIELAPPNPGAGLEEQVQNVADRVTQMIMTRMERHHPGAKKGAKASN
jgi:two-component sensor histidine kinase